MILSGKQLEALEILADRYDRGEIDDRQFIRMKQELLNTSNEQTPPAPTSTEAGDSPEQDSRFSRGHSEPAPQTEQDNDSSTVRKQREAALVFRGSKNKEPLAPVADAGDTRAEFLPVTQSQPKQNTQGTQAPGNYFEPPVSVPMVGDYERPKSSWLTSGLLPTLFTLFLSCAIIFWITQGNNLFQVDPLDETKIEAGNKPFSLSKARKPIISIRPLFGPLAVSECLNKCVDRGQSSAICQSACGRRSLSVYARQIASSDPNSKKDAAEIQRRCATRPENMPTVSSRDEWLRTTAGAMASIAANPQRFKLGDARSAKERYNIFVNNRNNLRMLSSGDRQSRQLSDQILETTCLGAHISLVELGMLLAQQNNDAISRRYYYDLFKKLGPAVIEVERRLIQNAAEMNLVTLKKSE